MLQSASGKGLTGRRGLLRLYGAERFCMGARQDAEKAAKRLTDEAYCRGSNDNISCVVIRFGF